VAETEEEPAYSQVLVMPAQEAVAGVRLQKLPPLEGPASDDVGGDWEGGGPFEIRDLAEARCSQAVLGFLSATEVEQRVPPPAGEDAQSEAPEWQLRTWREGEEKWRQEAEEPITEEE